MRKCHYYKSLYYCKCPPLVQCIAYLKSGKCATPRHSFLLICLSKYVSTNRFVNYFLTNVFLQNSSSASGTPTCFSTSANCTSNCDTPASCISVCATPASTSVCGTQACTSMCSTPASCTSNHGTPARCTTTLRGQGQCRNQEVTTILLTKIVYILSPSCYT